VLGFTIDRPNRADDSYEEEGILLVGVRRAGSPSASDSKRFLSRDVQVKQDACFPRSWTFMPEESLNSNHARRLSVTCRHIDRLLADMETALAVADSKRAFPEYLSDVTAVQRRAIEEHIARMRVQLGRVLDGQGIERPEPFIPVSRCLHTALTFIRIAAEELQPRHMRGYGEVSLGAGTALNRIALELMNLATQFDDYVTRETRGRTQPPEDELGKIERDDTNCSST
jgi:hypothetical protein